MIPDRAALVDSHLHLQDEVFSGCLPEVLDQAAEAGVHRLVVNGAEESDWPRVLELARRHPQVVPCFGLHPWYVCGRSRGWLERLEFFLREVPSAVGEIGLDRWQKGRDEAAQEEVFRDQLGLARHLGRPVMIHCLQAWGWMLRVLREEDPLPAGFLLHAFGGSRELLPVFQEMGAYFSFAGNVLEDSKAHRRQVLKAVLPERLLLESDAPDLPLPVPFGAVCRCSPQGRRISEPAHVKILYREVSRLREEPLADMAERIWHNSSALLRPVLGLP